MTNGVKTSGGDKSGDIIGIVQWDIDVMLMERNRIISGWHKLTTSHRDVTT